MSRTTDIIVVAGHRAGGPQGRMTAILEEFADSRGHPGFVQVDSLAGGNKAFGLSVWMGTFNYLSLDSFLPYVFRCAALYRGELLIQLMIREPDADLFDVFDVVGGELVPRQSRLPQ